MVTLFTDTDTDITPKVAAEYGYKLISMPYSYNGKTVYPYEDFDVFDAHAFYDMLRSGVLPTTSALGQERYMQYFEPEFAEGNDIFYVHFSRAMTNTFDSMDRAVATLKEKYPERKFWELDTKGITIGSYNIVREVGDLFLKGKTPEEIIEGGKTEVDKFSIYFFADDLKFFRRSGRVSGLAATMGSLIGIRPIIHMNSEGKMVSIGKAKGRRNAIEALIGYVDELGEDVTAHRIVVAQTDAMDIATRVGELLKQKYGPDIRLEYVDCNPTAGSHCGPNGVGVSFHAKHR